MQTYHLSKKKNHLGRYCIKLDPKLTPKVLPEVASTTN